MQNEFASQFMKSTLIFIYLPLILVLLIFVIHNLIEKQKLVKLGISDIDKLDGKMFEKYLEVLFEKLGYKVEGTRYIGDYGADLIIQKDNVKTVVQAKRYKGKVGVRAIQEAVAAKGYYNCDKAMVITNSHYTHQAEELADRNGVELWNRKDLIRNLLRIKDENEIKVGQKISEDIPDNSKNKCAICGVTVSDKVRQYCLSHPERFGGKIYCYNHQKEIGISKDQNTDKDY